LERWPSYIIELMNFCTRSLPYTESLATVRRETNPLRGISFFSHGRSEQRPYIFASQMAS
jgi:hypothetical protein